VVHLSGAPVAGRRWTAKYKEEIRASRVESTRVLAEALARREHRPEALITASAVGYYGDRGDEILDEDSPAGTGFFPEVCSAWEAAARPAEEAGIRVVHLRFGVVLGAKGGALEQMLPLFRLGLGGRLGSGRQWMSWVSEADVAGAALFALNGDGLSNGLSNDRLDGTGLDGAGLDGGARPALSSSTRLSGPVNVVGPQAVTNAEFTRELGRAVHRPAIMPAPAFALRLAFGEMADEALLASQRVRPKQLLEAGFAFRHATLTEALAAALPR
jgi:NAD dependent epimerase/dehydratase family enzyme